MKEFLDFFEFMPPYYKMAFISFSLMFCWALEYRKPLFNFKYSKFKHGRINLYFLLMISVINFVFGLFLVVGLDYFQGFNFGLFQLLDLPKVVELIIAVLILDFVAQYVIHVCLHKFSWMWKFHIVHHSDRFLDATSGTRHHPIDYALREVFSFAILVSLGIPSAYYFLFRFCSIFFTYFNHSNIVLPRRLNNWLSIVFVTPNLHKFHHHQDLPWTDKNYGNIFSFWDRIFGTLVRENPKKVRFGIDTLGDKPNDNFLELLLLPWKMKKRNNDK
ncbi:MAG: sterol desaturase/sphingolipid hydroxylase (fatty acid hydroxylase superfamily) [Flavobacteriaceae bacterium]|jgi:sterol desaturase/sphingolipid hydroxylase (fatty acid hydroxylase superfamily)